MPGPEKSQAKTPSVQPAAPAEIQRDGEAPLPPGIAQRMHAPDQRLTPNDVQALQRTVGNRVVQRVLGRDGASTPSAQSSPDRSASQPDVHRQTIESSTPKIASAPKQDSVQRLIDREVYESFVETASKVGTKKDAKTKRGVLTPTYRKVKEALDKYTQKQHEKSVKWKIEKLEVIEKGIRSWLGSSKHQKDTSENASRRRRAFMALQPIIRKEIATIDPKYTDKNLLKNSGVVAKGMTKSVTEVEFDRNIGESDTSVGMFAPPPTSLSQDVAKAQESGIDLANPNLGNRTLAVVRIAKLFGSNVMAESISAKIGGVQGILMEKARGVSPLRIEWTELTNENDIDWAWEEYYGNSPMRDLFQHDVKTNKFYKRKEMANRINYSHPEIQRQFVEMQLLDVITGQVDRHAGNYFVDQSNGKNVVKGIDLDLSFGKEKGARKMKGQQDSSMQKLPPIVHKGFAQRITQTQPASIREVLAGLLTPEEIELTVVRHQAVCDYLVDLFPDRWVDSFDHQTAAMFDETNSYLGRDRLRQDEMADLGLVHDG